MVPGNLSERQCNKYKALFESGDSKCTYQSGYGYSITTSHGSNAKINAACMSIRAYMTPMRMLLLAGLIDKWQDKPDDLKTTDPYYHRYDFDYTTIRNDNAIHPVKKYAKWLFPSSSYDHETYLSFVGWETRFLDGSASGGREANPKFYLAIAPHTELENHTFKQSVIGHNTILIRRFQDNYKQITGGGSYEDNPNTLAISSKVSSQLDAKIDDGRPGTGRLLASKADRDENYCYDKMWNQVDKAIYNKDDRTDYGCNLIKVMEDVK